MAPKNEQAKDHQVSRKQISSKGNKKSPNVETEQSSLTSSLKNVVVAVGVTLIVFAAFRNSLTWHLQNFWGASGDFWQTQWDKVLDTFGEDTYAHSVYGLTLYSAVIYWILGLLFMQFDTADKPTVLTRYKVQPGTNSPVNPKKLRKAMLWVLFNQTVVNLIFAHFWYNVVEMRGMPPLRELPTFQRVLLDLAVFIIVEEIAFYYFHRLLHHRLLYRHIHKKHHEWTAPIALIAVYCHPLEHVASNIVPVLLGGIIMGSHITTMYIWLSLAILNTAVTHSGYHLPFLMSPEDHDFHHLKFNVCYGVLGVLDRLHGTDAAFRKSPAYKRHSIMLTLRPAREVFPDK